MNAQRLIIFCLLLPTLSQGRISINYLVRVTNKSSKPFKLYCNNHYYRPIVRGNSNEFTMSGADVPESVATQDELKVRELNNLLYGWGQRDSWDARANGLYTQKTILENELFNEKRSDYFELKRKQVAELTRQINDVVDQLRPIIPPNATYNTSCRIFSPADKPKNHSNFTTDFPLAKDKTWEPLPTMLKSGNYTISVIDNDQRAKCPNGFLLIEAKSSTGQKTSTCIQNSVDASKVSLIITDGGFALKEDRFGIVEPVEQGFKYTLPEENYHAAQADYSDPTEKKEKLQPQIDDFTKAE